MPFTLRTDLKPIFRIRKGKYVVMLIEAHRANHIAGLNGSLF